MDNGQWTMDQGKKKGNARARGGWIMRVVRAKSGGREGREDM
jgi:hypothetical protein